MKIDPSYSYFKTVLLMAIIFGIFTISRGYPAEFVLFLAVFFLALATAVLELIYRLFNLAENIGKSKMLMVKTFLDYYLPIGRCVSIAWALMICSSVGKTQGKFALVGLRISYFSRHAKNDCFLNNRLSDLSRLFLFTPKQNFCTISKGNRF